MTLMFFMIHLVPGDPARILLGPRATPEMIADISMRMGLDQPLIIQLIKFLGNILKGDLGMDVISNRPVTAIVFGQLPYTLWLIFSAIFWCNAYWNPSWLLFSFASQYSCRPYFRCYFCCMYYCTFICCCIVFFAYFCCHSKVVPSIGAGEKGDFFDQLAHLVLPAFAIGLAWVGYLSRLVRASMLEVMGENHIRTARAYGLTESTIIYRYALKIAILPTVTVIGVGMGFLISAAVLTEIVFARPGLGKLIIESITSRNYPVVMGSVLISTVLFVISTTISDLVNAFLDPRIRANL